MDKIIPIGKTIALAVGGFIGAFLGGVDGLIYTLLALNVIDFFSGMAASKEMSKKDPCKGWSSKVGFVGITKKFLIYGIIGVCHMLDLNVIGDGAVLRTAAIFFYMTNEGLSIIENAAIIGLPVPEKLKDILAQLKDKK